MSKQLLISVVMLAFFACFIKSRRWMLAMYILSFSIPIDYGFYTFFQGYVGKSTADLRLAFIDFTFIMLVISGIITRGSLLWKSSVIRKNEFFFLIAYFLFCLFSLFWAGDRILVIAEVFTLLKILVVFFYFLRNSEFIYKNINYVIYGTLGIAVIQFTFSILQVTTGQLINFDYLLGYDTVNYSLLSGSFYRFGAYRALGSMGPGQLAIMMGTIGILGFSLLTLPRFYKIRRIGFVVIILSATTLLLTQSRAFIGSASISLILIWLFMYRGRQKIKFITILIGIPLIFLACNYERLLIFKQDFILNTSDAYALRNELNKNATNIILQNPANTLMGIGQNNYLEYQDNKSGLYLTERMRELPVHNSFLLEFSESGLIGVFFAFSFFLLIIYHWKDYLVHRSY